MTNVIIITGGMDDDILVFSSKIALVKWMNLNNYRFQEYTYNNKLEISEYTLEKIVVNESDINTDTDYTVMYNKDVLTHKDVKKEDWT